MKSVYFSRLTEPSTIAFSSPYLKIRYSRICACAERNSPIRNKFKTFLCFLPHKVLLIICLIFKQEISSKSCQQSQYKASYIKLLTCKQNYCLRMDWTAPLNELLRVNLDINWEARNVMILNHTWHRTHLTLFFAHWINITCCYWPVFHVIKPQCVQSSWPCTNLNKCGVSQSMSRLTLVSICRP